MRDIRARISQGSGIEISNQQIEELAARRLEAILDPRTVRPSLLDQLRRTSAERTPVAETLATTAPPPFEEDALYDSRNGLLRAIRRLMNPLLRLFINPTPVAHALAQQAAHASELRAHAAEQDKRQAEWNALQYEILQRLVVEVSRVSLEAQALALKVDALAGRVEFADHRVRTLEGSQPRPPARPERTERTERPERQERPERPERPEPHAVQTSEGSTEPGGTAVSGEPSSVPEGAPRRRRRRRRGRRAPGAGLGTGQGDGGVGPADMVGDDGDGDEENGGDEQGQTDAPVAAAPSESPVATADAPPLPPPDRGDTESQ